MSRAHLISLNQKAGVRLSLEKQSSFSRVQKDRQSYFSDCHRDVMTGFTC